MTMFLIQSAILIAITFLVGCILGCIFRRLLSTDGTTVYGKSVGASSAGNGNCNHCATDAIPAPA